MENREQFINADTDERNIFISKLIHAISNNDCAFRDAKFIVWSAEITGMFNNVKFGADAVYKEEAINQ